VKELADYLSVHPSTIYRMLARKELPSFKIGSDWRFHREAIDDWIRSKSSS
jgi:excisionase family DNA binding protein